MRSATATDVVILSAQRTAFGTFGGVVKVVDYTASDNGEFRVLVTPDPEEDPWPDLLRIGGRVVNDLPPRSRDIVRLEEELADILIYLVRICDKLDVDLYRAVERKIAINAAKYPADRVRGSAKKYTEYED